MRFWPAVAHSVAHSLPNVAECPAVTRPRVPAVYLTHAILAILADCAERGINNLHAFSELWGSNPTRASKFLVAHVGREA